jgi:hypothetical protein
MTVKGQEKFIFILVSVVFILEGVVVYILAESWEQRDYYSVALDNFILNSVTVQLVFELNAFFQVFCFSEANVNDCHKVVGFSKEFYNLAFSWQVNYFWLL